MTVFNVFQIGTLVHCIDDDFPIQLRNTVKHLPKKGIVYEVRQVYPTPTVFGITLNELVNIPLIQPLLNNRFAVFEPNFSIDRFEILGHIIQVYDLFSPNNNLEYDNA